ncbi:DUF3145 domain-containing protein [Kitasatospora nipponensis]|uniref:DUF3145 domain-containing protein n=1 Tax=Kitasatospora nipponensis TaxID=258049 RepID=A0ABN1VMZ7_9ACTN
MATWRPGPTGHGTRQLGKATLVHSLEVPVTTRGVLYIHSAPRALCPHVEWAVAGVLGVRVNLDWIRQPAAPGHWRSEFSWQGEVGTASRLASALRGWQLLRYEVTSEPCSTAEGERYSSTPALGIFHAVTGIHGDILIPEDRLRAVLLRARSEGTDLEAELSRLLGKPWDDELEPFRYAGEGAPVRWLHQVV